VADRKRTAPDWQAIRAQYEAGGEAGTCRALARRHGLSHTAIAKRARAEGWTQDLEPAIQRKVTAAVAGAVSAGHPQKAAEAIDAEAARRAEVLKRHREEWNGARERLYSGLRAHKEAASRDAKVLAFEDLKAAKISAETLQIMQAAERKAWRLDDPAPPDPAPGSGQGRMKVEVVFVDETIDGGATDDD
jgi:hypothetical protein